MKKLLLVLALFAVVGCEEKVYIDSATGLPVGQSDKKISDYKWKCVEGVVYLLYDRGITVAFKPDGTVAKCKGVHLL